MRNEAHLKRLDGPFYRIIFEHRAGDVLTPAQAPEGRSHYGGQRALYLSASPEGTVVAVRRYMSADDPPRVIFPLHVSASRIIDLRDTSAVAHYRIDVTHRAAEWQEIRARGLPSPTWGISDRVRELGMQGMLYASRSDPAKTHLTLFRWNEPQGAEVRVAGAPLPVDQNPGLP